MGRQHSPSPHRDPQRVVVRSMSGRRARGGRRGGRRNPHRDRGHIAFGPHSRGGRGRHRARRGAIVNAVLRLLDERPMHGYELITELEDRSEGRWRPSAGTMYPALGRMEEAGLISSEEVDGKKRFSLTETGRERLDQYLAERSADDREPWDDHGTGHRGDLRRHVAELVGQARQIGRFGTAEQIGAAVQVFDDAKRQLYSILAEPAPTGTDGEPANEENPVADDA